MKTLQNRWLNLMLHSVLASLLFLTGERADANEKITIGGVEDVILLPWNIIIQARIDTGAATSSLDVREFKIRGKKEIEFTLPDRCGGLKIRLPIIAWRHIQSTEGFRERRPVVELEFCLGSKRLRTQVTLNDRSQMEFPLLIGRRALEGIFIVDVSRSKTPSSSCSKGLSP